MFFAFCHRAPNRCALLPDRALFLPAEQARDAALTEVALTLLNS